MKQKRNKILIAFLIAFMVLGTFTGCSGDMGGKAKKDYSNIVENPNISIPGFESLDFKAGREKQSVNFYNPEENTCYFRISLVLKQRDGAGAGGEEVAGEDTLWTSELIEPGEEVKSIELDKELESGDYPAILKYECFSLKDETPLNGAKVEVIIHVKE